MVVSQVQQPEGTYVLLKRFTFPDADRGTVDAVAVSAEAGRYILSAYTILSSLIVVHIWAIIIACGFFFYLRNPRNKVTDISVSLWNKRAATQQSITDVLLYAREDLKKWWYYPLLFAVVAAWAAGIVAGIFIPNRVFLGNAAPVDARSIYVPSSDYNDFPDLYNLYALDVQPYLRAAGAALVANDTLRDKVSVGQPIPLGQNEKGSVQRIEYGYIVTGADMGLQYVPHLRLTVNGSCVTDYGWWQRTDKLNTGGLQDDYLSPLDGTSYQVSGLDSPAPSASFIVQDPLPRQNISWGAVVSSVDRLSFTPSRDPWYQTMNFTNNGTKEANIKVPYIVMPGRPALSCWQNDIWSYSGQTASVGDLAKIVPPGALSDDMVKVLDRYLGRPVIYTLGQHLGVSALQSMATSVGSSFDAGGSSFAKDLKQLILGSYIATVNTLTDTTLYLRPKEGSGEPSIANMASDGLGKPLPGVDAFIVYTNEATAFSVAALITVPCLALGTWLLMIGLFKLSPLRLATAMEVIEYFQLMRKKYGEARIERRENGELEWVYNNKPPSSSPGAKPSPGTPEATSAPPASPPEKSQE